MELLSRRKRRQVIRLDRCASAKSARPIDKVDLLFPGLAGFTITKLTSRRSDQGLMNSAPHGILPSPILVSSRVTRHESNDFRSKVGQARVELLLRSHRTEARYRRECLRECFSLGKRERETEGAGADPRGFPLLRSFFRLSSFSRAFTFPRFFGFHLLGAGVLFFFCLFFFFE